MKRKWYCYGDIAPSDTLGRGTIAEINLIWFVTGLPPFLLTKWDDIIFSSLFSFTREKTVYSMSLNLATRREVSGPSELFSRRQTWCRVVLTAWKPRHGYSTTWSTMLLIQNGSPDLSVVTSHRCFSFSSGNAFSNDAHKGIGFQGQFYVLFCCSVLMRTQDQKMSDSRARESSFIDDASIDATVTVQWKQTIDL